MNEIEYAEFARKGLGDYAGSRYLVMRNCLSPDILERHLASMAKEVPTVDVQIKLAHSYARPQFGQTLLSNFLDFMTRWSQQPQLYPVNSYARTYYRGSRMLIHLDRPYLQFSGTMTLDQSGSWPIYLILPNKDGEVEQELEINLEPGDMLVYRGNQQPHYRKMCETEYVKQVFLHYCTYWVDYTNPPRELVET